MSASYQQLHFRTGRLTVEVAHDNHVLVVLNQIAQEIHLSKSGASTEGKMNDEKSEWVVMGAEPGQQGATTFKARQLVVGDFVGLYAGKRNLPPIAGKLLEKLYNYDWPGNVRELQNVIVRYCNQRHIDLMGSSSRPEAPPASRDDFPEFPEQPVQRLTADHPIFH